MKVDPKLSSLFDACVAQCCEWFGTPPDITWNVEWIVSRGVGITKCRRQPLYLIGAPIDPSPNVEVEADIARTAFVRVASGLRAEGLPNWIWELLSERTCAQLLLKRTIASLPGCSAEERADYVRTREEAALQWEPIADISSVLKSSAWVRRFNTKLAGRYAASIWLAGKCLDVVASWDKVCKLLTSASFDEWLSKLDSHTSRRIREHLNWR